MSNASMTPGSRPRRGLIAIAGAAAAALGLGAVVWGAGEAVSPPPPVGAAELSTFASCEELAEWGQEAIETSWGGEELAFAEGDVATSAGVAEESSADAPVATARDGGAGADEQGSGTGDTNVDVEGVDELDLVDRLDGERVLVRGGTTLALVDLGAGEELASRPVAPDAEITSDQEAGVVWVVGHGDAELTVERITVGEGSLTSDGAWRTPGHLVDARRVGGQLHVVASDGFDWSEPVVPWSAPTVADEAALPFGGEAVPCDEVLHPEGPSEPAATLIATLPATGPVEPVRSTEVVGSGDQVHVTLDSAYVSTPLWEESEPTTGLHRFDLATLTPTGSGRVEGTMLDQFSLSEHDGHLRVAVTTGTQWGPAGDVVVEPANGRPAPEDSVEVAEGRNEVVVLDTEGDLDVVGRTERFGKPGESIHGVRFVGDVAYAVTFLTTDPFYVVDLADPSAPHVVGEVELPGFSSYLHPVSADLVVGFGPDGDGRTAAKLFDVSDPTAPRVASDVSLGDESAVAWDHHAFVALDELRFAVPATDWQMARSEVVVVEVRGDQLVEEERVAVPGVDGASRALPTADGGWAVLAYDRLVVVDADGGVRAEIPLG